MEKIKPGIYTARPDSELSPIELRTRRELTGEIRAKATEMARRAYIVRHNAMLATDKRREQRIYPETGKREYEART